MDISFFGAARSVTGSMFVLTVQGRRILLECGLFQGHRQESYERNSVLPFDAKSIDAMVLSHAHIDHSGNIPSLVSQGFQGSIFATFATRDLCAAMLRDSGHIQEADAEYVNKKRARQHLPPIRPLYTQDDAKRSLRNFISIDYHRTFDVAPGVRCTFYDAGHILGSAIVVLDLQEGDRTVRLTFTGDLGRRNLPILRDPDTVPHSEILLTESTYGNRDHESPGEAKVKLAQVINETYRRHGKVVIPAFAVGKTQELVYDLNQLSRDDEIPDLPVYVDSPLAVNVTEVFRLHPECYDREMNEFMTEYRTSDPFGFDRLYYIRQVEESKALNTLDRPAVIISASGMAEAGRILHHLKNNVEDPRNSVLIVGFQAADTLGRRIVERRPEISIFGEPFQLRAQVDVITGYSAHADRKELLSWIAKVNDGSLRRAIVVHGEEESSLALADALTRVAIPEVLVPQRLDTVTI